MMWGEARGAIFDDIMQADRLLNSLHMNQLAKTLTSQIPPIEEEVSLGAFLFRVLFSALIRFSWLLWRILVLSWIPLYYPYVQYILSRRIPFVVGVAAWLVFLVDHDPLSFTTCGRPAGVWFTSADLYQLWYWLAAPILCRTAYRLPSLSRDIHAKAVLGFNNAFDVDISLSDYVIECYKPTPPRTPCDDAFRLLLRETHLDRIDANVDEPECEPKSRNLLPRMNDNAHLGWDMYSKVLKKRKQRRAACNKGLVVHRLRLEPDGQAAADRDGEKKTPGVLAILEYSGTLKPHLLHLLQLALKKVLNRSMELNDLPPPSADGRILIDDLTERCGPNNAFKKIADTSLPKLTVETHVDKKAKLLSSTEVLDDPKAEAVSVRASEELELSPIAVDVEENKLSADKAGKKEYTDCLKTLRTSDEEMRKGSTTLEAEHLQEQDIVAAHDTAAEEHHLISGMDFDMLDTSLHDVQTIPSAEAQLIPSPTEREQPMLEENGTEVRYSSEEIQGSPENGATSLKDHQLNPDEPQNNIQNPLPLTTGPCMAPISMPLALKHDENLDEITQSDEINSIIQVQLPDMPEFERAAEDTLLPVDDDCDNKISKEMEDGTNYVNKDSILAEIISQSKSQPHSNGIDRGEAFIQLLEHITLEDGDPAMTDILWEPEFEEESHGREVHHQEDCDMLDKTYMDVSQDEESCPYGDDMVMAMDDMQDPNFQQDVEMTSCVARAEELAMQTPEMAYEWAQNAMITGILDELPAGYTMSRQTQAPMDLCLPIRATETEDSDQLMLMDFPERPASMTVYNSHATPRPEEQLNDSVSKYQLGLHREDTPVPKSPLEKACLQTENEFGKGLVHEICVQLPDRQPEMPQQMAIGYFPSNKETQENDMTQVHPPQNTSKTPNQDNDAKIESAEENIMGRIDTVDRASRETNLKDEEKIFSGKSDETKPLLAVQNIDVPEPQEQRKIFDTLSTSFLLPFLTLPNEAGFDAVDGKTSFDFEAIQLQEDEELERDMVAAYVADSDTQNVSGALGKDGYEKNIFFHDCKDLSQGSISNDEAVEEYPLNIGETETDDEEIPSLQRGKVGAIVAESQSQLPSFSSQPGSRTDREDEHDQVARPFSQGSLDSSTARKSTAEQAATENLVKAPEEYADESPSMERNAPKETEDEAYEKVDPSSGRGLPCASQRNPVSRTTLQPSTNIPEPDQEAPAYLMMDGLKLPAGNPMHDGSPSQPIADLSTSVIQRTQSPGPSENVRLEKMKKAYIKARSRPPRLFHNKTRRASSTPYGTRSMGSIDRDEQLRSSDGMITLNRQYSTNTQPTEGTGDTDQQRTIKVIPIKALGARNTVDEESENAADHTRGVEGGSAAFDS